MEAEERCRWGLAGEAEERRACFLRGNDGGCAEEELAAEQRVEEPLEEQLVE